MLLVASALAAGLEDPCPTIAAPADARALRDEGDRGIADAFATLDAAAAAWSDGCTWTWSADGADETCVTPSGASWWRATYGDAITWSTSEWSVEPPSGSWTRITSSETADLDDWGTSRSVSWAGTVSDLPADGTLAYGLGGYDDMSGSWSETSYRTPGCSWSTGSYTQSETSAQVVRAGVTVEVRDYVCTYDPDWIFAHDVAFVNDVLYGHVDPDTWELDDADRDAYGPGDDCDDADPAVNPCAVDVPFDGIDQDCSGADALDGDGDGADAADWGGADCDDADTAVGPEARDPAGDGIDQNCDGADEVDADGDGYTVDGDDGPADCDDTDAFIHPGAGDRHYDGIDQDCDGTDYTRWEPEEEPSACAATSGGAGWLLVGVGAALARRRRP